MDSNTEAPESEDLFSSVIDSLTNNARLVFSGLGGELLDQNTFYSEFIEPTYFDIESPYPRRSYPEGANVVIDACAEIGKAASYYDEGYVDEAWYLILTCSLLIFGLYRNLNRGEDENSKIEKIIKAKISSNARRASDKAHEEHRALRAQAFAWLKDHFEQDGLTNDSAAEKLGKVVPVAFSTRLAYVKSWRRSR